MENAMSIDNPASGIAARAVVLTDFDTGEELATVTATIVSLKHRQETGIYGRMVGLDARLNVLFSGDAHPHSFFLSRLVKESFWVQDAHFGPNGFPYFSNGFGARYLKVRGIHPALAVLLDEAARALGLTAQIGLDIPLVLPDTDPADGDRA